MTDLAGAGPQHEGMHPCDCGRVPPTPPFDAEASRVLSSHEVRQRWPRLHHVCECGRATILYASFEHYLAGDY